MSEAKQLKKLFEDTKREMAKLKPWQKTNRVPLAAQDALIFAALRAAGLDRLFKLSGNGANGEGLEIMGKAARSHPMKHSEEAWAVVVIDEDERPYFAFVDEYALKTNRSIPSFPKRQHAHNWMAAQGWHRDDYTIVRVRISVVGGGKGRKGK